MKKCSPRKLVLSLLVMIILGFFAVFTPNFVSFVKADAGEYLGRLHIGNETLGENPCFFYDENSHLVTLRCGGEYDFYPSIDGGAFWGSVCGTDGSISILKNTSANFIRIQLYVCRLYDTRNTRNSYAITRLTELRNALLNIVGNGSYFVLTWYLVADSEYPPNWFTKELNETSIFWNTTTRNDLVWCINDTFQFLNEGTIFGNNLMDYCAYWSFNEWLWWASNLQNAQTQYVGELAISPWRFSNRTDYKSDGASIALTPNAGSQNIANQSWIEWLQERYNYNIDNVKGNWTTQTSSYWQGWNWSGNEDNTFGSLLMVNSTSGYIAGRGMDLKQWMHEVMYNCTTYIRDEIKSGFPNIPFGVDTYSPNAPQLVSRYWYSGYDPCYLANITDVLLYHIYAEYANTTVNSLWFQGDKYRNYWSDVGAVGRTAKKPVLVDECGHSPSFQETNYPSTPWWTDEDHVYYYRYWIAGYYNVSTTLAIQNGIAGFASWFGYARWYSSNSTHVRSQWFQQIIRNAYDTYKSAETWIDKIQYDPILLLYEYRDLDGRGMFMWNALEEAGYRPKYVASQYNGSIYPTIPVDTEIIIMSPGVHGWSPYGYYMCNATLTTLNDFLDNGKHVILSYARNADRMYGQDTLHYENNLNTSYIPLTSTVFESTYNIDDDNTTTIHIDVYGQSIAINRSATSRASYEVHWTDAQISGVRLINFTDGEVSGGNPQAFCIINNHIAWISNLLGETAQDYVGNPSPPYGGGIQRNVGYGLIYKKIFEFWNHYPMIAINTTLIHQKLSGSIANLSSTKAVLAIYDANFSHTTIQLSLNITEVGLEAGNYVCYNAYNDTISNVDLSSELTLTIRQNMTTIFVFAKNDESAFLYSTAYRISESWNAGTNTSIVNLRGNNSWSLDNGAFVNVTVKMFNFGREITSCQVNGSDVEHSSSGNLSTIEINFDSDAVNQLVIIFGEGAPPEDTYYVTVSISSPTNTTYSSGTITVTFTVSTNGTLDQRWYNCKNGSDWIYTENQTYTGSTSMTGFVNVTSYTFYAWANITEGESDEKTVMFSVAIGEGVNWWQMSFAHKDLDLNNVDAKITWQFYNASQQLTYTEGQYSLLDGTYTLKTYYHGFLINQTSLATSSYGNSTVNILLQMKAQTYGYVAFNNTVSSITINNQSITNITFTVSGSAPALIILDVPTNASYIQKDGVNQTWTYYSNYLTLSASSLSSAVFMAVFSSTLEAPWFAVTVTLTVVGSGVAIWFYRRLKKNRERQVE